MGHVGQNAEYQRLLNRSKLMDLAQDVLIVLDSTGVILDVNEAAARLHGTSIDQLIGTNVVELLHENSVGHMMDVSGRLLLAEADGSDSMLLDAVVANGDIVNLELRVSFSHEDQQFYVVERDITAQHQRTVELEALSEKLRVLAATDTLTGIANRASFDQRMEEIVASDEDAWLVIIDVDGFKSINDTYGHVVGDGVLKTIANKLSAQLNSNETFARIGGDEFAIILPVTHEINVDERITFIEEAVQGLLQIDGTTQVPLTCSVGACQRQQGESIDEWHRRSDRQMYVQKNGSRSLNVA